MKRSFEVDSEILDCFGTSSETSEKKCLVFKDVEPCALKAFQQDENTVKSISG